MPDYLAPHLIRSKPIPSHGKAACAECGGPVSTYTEPQPVTGVRLCNRHWTFPEGYALSGSGRIIKEANLNGNI